MRPKDLKSIEDEISQLRYTLRGGLPIGSRLHDAGLKDRSRG